MINKDELLFTVDENNQPVAPLGRTLAHEQGVWHRTTDIAVVNSKKELLCHKRSMLKDAGPGMWDICFGGHILAGVDPIKGAMEELEEESGLKVAEPDLKFLGTVQHISRSGKNKEFRYVYIYYWDGPMSDLKLEKDEVEEVRWTDIETIKNNRDNSEHWSGMPQLETLLAELK